MNRCKQCRNPMRGHRQTLKDNPGTVKTGANGYCFVCRRRQKALDTTPPPDTRPTFDVNFARTCERLWIADRRKRLGQTK